jgi:Tfp pilus assembly pilus retraction ATPase PilT
MAYGMVTMDSALADLVRRGVISLELAQRRSSTPDQLTRLLGAPGQAVRAS